ncbi:MAG: prolipoprotein diacylglyceryl transferase [Candidatus Melainabacteria bacterium]|nr:prolipoprotein diacylglyceryl transferase [Candidatus Melainabacteria bacterium]
MTFVSPGPVLIDLGFVSLRWYGLLYALGFIAALSIAEKYLCPKDTTKEELSNFFVYLLLFGLLGARLWFVLLNLDYYLANPAEILQIWLGGQSIQGGIIGACLGAWLMDRRHYLAKLSAAATVVPLAQAIARWGNFFNEEAYGSVTDLPWKLFVTHTGEYHHPCFLYESIWNLLVFAVLFKSYNQARPVRQISAYLILYSLGRLAIEQLRLDQILVWNTLSAGTLMAIVGMVVGLITLFVVKPAKSHHN